MLYFDATNSIRSKTKSGLQRVSNALAKALEAETAVARVAWCARVGCYRDAANAEIHCEFADTLLVPDLFAEEDRPGFGDFIARCPGKTVAIFHDAIPLRFPEFTWPHSVRKHPQYLKDLAGFNQVLAVSSASRDDLAGYWQWLKLENTPPIAVVPSGADIQAGRLRRQEAVLPTSRQILQTGILEPRKNQAVSLAAAEILHRQGIDFRLGFVGRINPHFGKPIQKAIRRAHKAGVPIKHHGKLSDEELTALYEQARFTLLPSRAEGNGLPVLESLWQGLPVICSNLPAAQDWASGDSVWVVDPLTADSLAAAIRHWLQDDDAYAQAVRHARAIGLPTWRDSARAILTALDQGQGDLGERPPSPPA